MNELLKCIVFLAAIGAISFVAGRFLPKKWFSSEKYPYRSFQFEKDGNIYNKIGVRKWKDGFPDMSVLLPNIIPSKKLPHHISVAQIELMIQETCIAEVVHEILALLGFGCVFIWKGIGGWMVSILYALGNTPYIIIQRYNRPKFQKLLYRLNEKEALL